MLRSEAGSKDHRATGFLPHVEEKQPSKRKHVLRPQTLHLTPYLDAMKPTFGKTSAF